MTRNCVVPRKEGRGVTVHICGWDCRAEDFSSKTMLTKNYGAKETGERGHGAHVWVGLPNDFNAKRECDDDMCKQWWCHFTH